MTTPAELYRNAIDLNRFSNSVAKRIARTYNDLILDAVDQLRGIDELAAPVKAARLRAILAQLKGSLDNWAEARYCQLSWRIRLEACKSVRSLHKRWPRLTQRP